MTIQRSPYLRNQRDFPPDDMKALAVEIDKAYIDIAQRVNERTIGVFPLNFSVATGEKWYITGSSSGQQTLRQVFTFTGTTSITHGIRVSSTNSFTNCFGSYTDGTNEYGLIFGTSVAITGQISFYLTSTQIVFVVDAGAPALTSGRIVLTWLSSS
jgi:hypothetical protein